MAAQAPSRLSLGHPPTAAPRRAAAVACSATRRHAVRPGSLAAPYSDQRAGTARRAEANAPQAAPAAAFDGTAAASRAATSSVIAARPAARLQGPGGALPSQAGRGALRRRRVAAPALEPAAASALRSYSDEVLATEGVTDTAPSDAALVYRDPDGFWQLKPDLKPGNPFERARVRAGARPTPPPLPGPRGPPGKSAACLLPAPTPPA